MLWVYDGDWRSVKFAVPAIKPPAGYLMILETGAEEVFVGTSNDPAKHIEGWMRHHSHPMSRLPALGRVAIALVEDDVVDFVRDTLFWMAPYRIYRSGNYFYATVAHARSLVMDVLQNRDRRHSMMYFGHGEVVKKTDGSLAHEEDKASPEAFSVEKFLRKMTHCD